MRQLAVLAAVLVGQDVLGRRPGVVDRREPARIEQLRHVPHAVARAGALLLRREGLALANAIEDVARVLGDLAGQLAVRLEEPAVRGVGRVGGDAGKFERLAVVPGGVAAAVADRDRMLGRCLVQIFPVQRPIELRIVEHEAGDPEARRGRLRLLLDRRLNLAHGPQVRVDAVQFLHAARVAVRVDEAGGDDHALRVDDRRARGREVRHVARRSDRDEAAVLDRKRLGTRRRGVAREHARVNDDEIGFADGHLCVRAQRECRLLERRHATSATRPSSECESAGERRAEAEKLAACIPGHNDAQFTS